jgi:hypothetical protein
MMPTSTMKGGKRRGKAGKTMKNRVMNWLKGKGKKSRKMGLFGGHGGAKMGYNGGGKMGYNGGGKMGLYGGASKMPAVGSKASVYHGCAKHTSGGLMRKDLMKTKHGRIVSRKKHALGKKALKNLVKAGFKAKKGTFKLFRK